MLCRMLIFNQVELDIDLDDKVRFATRFTGGVGAVGWQNPGTEHDAWLLRLLPLFSFVLFYLTNYAYFRRSVA